MGLYAIDENYGLSTWYEYSGAHDVWTGTDLLLDLSRHILESDAYVFRGISFPKGQDIYISPGQTFSGTINLIPFSYLLYVTGWSGNPNWEGWPGANQFTVRIYDKGAQTDVYAKQFGWYPSVISNMSGPGQLNMGQAITSINKDMPYGPYFFRDPLIVLPPGVLQIQLTNVSTDPKQQPNIAQMLFGVAVPKNTMSMQTRKVITAGDPTGTQTLQGVAGALNLLGS